MKRGALQLGLRRKILEEYGKKEIFKIEDITSFVREQRENLRKGIDYLLVPEERVYLPEEMRPKTQICH